VIPGLGAKLRRVDRPTLLLTITLCGLGLAAIASASADEGRLASGQAKILLLGAVALVPMTLIPYQRLLRYAPAAYLALVGALVAVLFVGPVINGSQRWLRAFGFVLQPSEPLKVVLVAALARALRFGRDLSSVRRWGPPLLTALIPMALTARQPDLGTSLLFAPTALAMLFVAGIPWRAVLALGGLGVAFAVAAFFFLLLPYQRERVLSTVFHERLADYEKAREGYQLGQSLLAVQSGGFAGAGWGKGPVTQSGRLPYCYSDFVFAAVSEEFGFVGAAGTLALLVLLVGATWRVALLTRDPSGRLLCVGVGTLIAAQSAVNVGVSLGVAPTTGMPLPFVSHGGSSLFTFLMGVGLVLNVSVHRAGGPGLLAGDRRADAG